MRQTGAWSDDLQKAVAVTLPNAIRGVVGDAYRVKGSAGAGNQAEIPWVSVMPPALKGASEGVYVVYLFAADGTRVFLSLSQAVTGQRKSELSRLAGELRAAAGEQPDLLSQIDLGAQGSLGQRYALATAYALAYEVDSLPAPDSLESDLARFLGLLDRAAGGPSAAANAAWIFQANPERYRIDEALRDRDSIRWVVRQHAKAIHGGDRAYIWRAGPEAGIVALARIVADPADLPLDGEDRYWTDSDSFDRTEPRVELRLERVLERPLYRKEILDHPVLGDLDILRFANGTNFRVTPEQELAIEALVGEPVRTGSLGRLDAVDLSLAERLFLPQEWLQEIVDLLEEKRQLIFYGPPGTGKTLVALEIARHLTAQGGGYRLVQFHPSYAYEDFFEGYRPNAAGNGIEFALTPGPLRVIAREAATDPANPYFLVVDEINRGNIAKIFGELLFLLEYRGQALFPQYSPNHQFTLPENLFLIGTMNTADRSIALVDAALRRRFYFKEFSPTREPVSSVLGRWLAYHEHDDMPARLLRALNDELARDEYSVGPSYFITRDGREPDLQRVWEYAILPLLEEYFYGTGREPATAFALEKMLRALLSEPSLAPSETPVLEGATATEDE